jgi:hypothetical protein
MGALHLRLRKPDARREHALARVLRKHRRGRGGLLLDLNKTFKIRGTTAIEVASFIPNDNIPIRTTPIVFATSLEVTANAGVHAGMIFEIGGTLRGLAAWIEDDKIVFRAGGAAASGEEALATYDAGAELEVGRRFDLVFFAHPGTGDVRIWDRGIELARDTSSTGDFNGEWAGSGGGSFAAAPNGAVPSDVTVGSQQSPNGFVVTRGLDVFVGQIPRLFG